MNYEDDAAISVRGAAKYLVNALAFWHNIPRLTVCLAWRQSRRLATWRSDYLEVLIWKR